MKLHQLLAVSLLTMAAASAHAAGLWLYESGAPDMATASAGRAALARDASTAATNPAGMTQLERSQVMVGALGLDIHSKFTGQTTYTALDGSVDTDGSGHNAGNFTPVGSLHYVHVADPDLRFGITTGSYFGLGMDYGDGWQGRYYVRNANLMTFAVNPSVAYKVNDWFSIGGGVSVLYGKLKEEVAINNSPLGLRNKNDGQLTVNSDDVGYGYNFGLLLTPKKGTRIGATYTSKIDLKFDDTATVDNATGPLAGTIASRFNSSSLDMNMTIPQTVTVSLVQQLTDNLALLANVGWQNWNQFGKFEVDASGVVGSTSKTLDADMKDTWQGAIGLHYRFAEPWLLMLGCAYDGSPIKNEKRSVALPLDRQIRYGTGIEYSVSKNLDLGCSYEYIDAGKSKVNQNRGPLAGNIVGQYDTNYISAFGLSMNYKF